MPETIPDARNLDLICHREKRAPVYVLVYYNSTSAENLISSCRLSSAEYPPLLRPLSGAFLIPQGDRRE